jgi:hypothetical protein
MSVGLRLAEIIFAARSNPVAANAPLAPAAPFKNFRRVICVDFGLTFPPS